MGQGARERHGGNIPGTPGYKKHQKYIFNTPLTHFSKLMPRTFLHSKTVVCYPPLYLPCPTLSFPLLTIKEKEMKYKYIRLNTLMRAREYFRRRSYMNDDGFWAVKNFMSENEKLNDARLSGRLYTTYSRLMSGQNCRTVLLFEISIFWDKCDFFLWCYLHLIHSM